MVTADEKRSFLERWFSSLGVGGYTHELHNQLYALLLKDALLDLCVLGSKPMALGASIFALKNPKQVKVSYPFPTQYCNHTTLDAAHTWIYRFVL